MKSAEFTDHASAQAFLAAGRKKGERATSDGWNTVLYDRGTSLVLELHGTPIVEYTPSRTTIHVPMRNHVVADRIQRYGLADKFQLNTVGAKWSLSQAWGSMPGIDEDPTIWYPVVADVPHEIVLDAGGVLASPPGKTMPTVLSTTDRAMIWEKPVKAWLSGVMKKLDAGWEFTASEFIDPCPLCTPANGTPGGTMLGTLANSPAHVMSHVLEGKILPSTVYGMAADLGWSAIRYFGAVVQASGSGRMGASGASFNHDGARRMLKNALRAHLR